MILFKIKRKTWAETKNFFVKFTFFGTQSKKKRKMFYKASCNTQLLKLSWKPHLKFVLQINFKLLLNLNKKLSQQ